MAAEVLLVGCAEFPTEPAGELLVDGFAAHGVTASWVRWDDPDVDWAEARAAVVRSTWDYCDRREEFLSWAKTAGAATRLLNSPEALRWNTDKTYLLDLASAGVPVVPSRIACDAAELRAAAAEFSGRVVVKPCVGVGGQGVVVFGSAGEVTTGALGPSPWLVQPVVESVRTEGETSVFVLGGLAAGQVRKVAAGDEIRVHEEYGGHTDHVDLDPVAARIATATVTTAERLLATNLVYARVDLMRLPDDCLAVSELEITEPGLYLNVAPGLAEPFCEAVTHVIRHSARG